MDGDKNNSDNRFAEDPYNVNNKNQTTEGEKIIPCLKLANYLLVIVYIVTFCVVVKITF